MLKQLLKSAAREAGIDLHKLESTPWGVDPFVDIASLAPTIEIAFDVGANLGQTHRKLREFYPTAQIHCFEPVPDTFAKLQTATRGDDRAICVPAALGDTEGRAKISIAGVDSGQNTLNATAKPDAPTVDICITTAVSYAKTAGVERIDLLKIDTEGFEMPVLQGARGLLEAGKIRFVLAECEFTHNPGEPHGDFFAIAQYLMPLGYRVVSFYSGGVDGDGWRWGDVLFMRPEGERPVTCSPFARL